MITTLSQLRPGKGLETLIDAAPLILTRHPRARLVICGSGPELEALRRRAASLAVEDVVHFLAWTGDPLSVLRGSDIFVLPSWAESFPYVVLEAMAAGVPVVATDVGGIHEAVTSGRHGLSSLRVMRCRWRPRSQNCSATSRAGTRWALRREREFSGSSRRS